MVAQVRSVISVLLVLFFPALAVSATIYLQDGRSIPADEISIKGGVLEYKVWGTPNPIPMNQVKSIDFVGNSTPPAQPTPPQRQQQLPSSLSVANQPNPISAIPESKARQDLKDELAQRYPDSYSTQELLFNTEMRDYKNLCQELSTPVSDGIMRDLGSRYYPRFSIIWMLYKKNAPDYLELLIR